MPQQLPWTRTDVDSGQLLLWLREGKTLTEIGDMVGVTKQTVSFRIRELIDAGTYRKLVRESLARWRADTATARRLSTVPRLNDRRELMRLYHVEGLPLHEIGRQIGVGRKAVEKAFKRLDIAVMRGPKAVGWRVIAGRRDHSGRHGWDKTVKIVKRRDNACRSCGRKDGLSLHHIVPFIICKTHHPAFVVRLCPACHSECEARIGHILRQHGLSDGYVFGGDESLPEDINSMLNSAEKRAALTLACLEVQANPTTRSHIAIKPQYRVIGNSTTPDAEHLDLFSLRIQTFDWAHAVRGRY